MNYLETVDKFTDISCDLKILIDALNKNVLIDSETVEKLQELKTSLEVIYEVWEKKMDELPF